MSRWSTASPVFGKRGSYKVLDGLLDGRDAENEEQRNERGESAGRRDTGHLLEHDDHEEEDVCILSELLEEKLGQKGDEVVFARASCAKREREMA